MPHTPEMHQKPNLPPPRLADPAATEGDGIVRPRRTPLPRGKMEDDPTPYSEFRRIVPTRPPRTATPLRGQKPDRRLFPWIPEDVPTALLFAVVVVGVAVLLLAMNMAYHRGYSKAVAGRNALATAAESAGGDVTRRLTDSLEGLGTKPGPDTTLGMPSLLVAQSALKAGEVAKAREQLSISLGLDRNVSQSNALLAEIELDDMRSADDQEDIKAKASELILRSINADAANPHPYLLMARMMRESGDFVEAGRALEKANALLANPDLHAAIEVARVLNELQSSPEGSMPPTSVTNVGRRWAAVYTAFRAGDTLKAIEALRACAAEHSPQVFNELFDDPAFTPYRDLPEVLATFPRPGL